ncbi:hypothetical protein GQ54DRAFT_239469, partial [Martensiomyces pterosporus]
KVRCHRVGQPQTQDVDIFTEHNEECFLDITRTKDRKFHVINSSTLDSSEVHIFSSCPKLQDKQAIHLVRPRQRGVEYYVDHHSDEFIILTNSPKTDDLRTEIAEPLPFRLVRSPSDSPSSEYWTDLLELCSDERIEDVEIFKDYLMVSIKRHGRPAVLVHNRITDTRDELPLPYNGNCAVRPEPNPQFDSATVRLCFSSPVHLESVIEYDMSSLKQSRSVPLTLIHHESALLSGAPPTLLRAYGAYGVSLEPEFRLEDIPLLLRGWVVALAHVSSVKDFLACSRFLLDKGWAAPEQLAATGVSAGGLVVGAALNMNPEYYRAAALHVPFVDPLSAMLSPDLPLTSVEFAEWGNPLTDAAAYSNIRQYAPYDNIKNMVDGKRAPSILVTAGGQDQRVSVWQPAKWVARLR